ncbi:MAG: rhomboid family intramembrane serine protease [Bacteroidales bacterium]|jgi:membrane associated rhomboid family serine protease|nr:rhomboid family intramembrane serine protease [Bacteroidales bacterium]
MSVIEEIKASFKSGSALIKLIYINLAVFLAVSLLGVLVDLLEVNYKLAPVYWLAVTANISELVYKPWTLFTYMFVHEDFLHIIFNLLWFYWFGQIFLKYFNEKKLISLYILGGLAGAVLYILAFNAFSIYNPSIPMIGASASVIAIVVAISFYIPDHTINLMFIGPVKLKYIAIGSVIIDILSITSSNAGGHIAHLGGALFGYLYIMQMKKGRNIAKGFDRFMDKIFSLFKPKPKVKVSYRRPINDLDRDIEYNKTKAEGQKEVDKILDKIAKSGYDSLSKKEKELLFKNSK